ncbi:MULTISPECIES: hypothetical protein [unclassified Fusibacter]|nr:MULTISPECIES: hypothetical protein [unclassified Fusibacter]MCK8059246.1 hypothetical protein [Fusibacter sp. A2]NPE21290.1 hypothetical protein [Fusibacter sp. A1]
MKRSVVGFVMVLVLCLSVAFTQHHENKFMAGEEDFPPDFGRPVTL